MRCLTAGRLILSRSNASPIMLKFKRGWTGVQGIRYMYSKPARQQVWSSLINFDQGVHLFRSAPEMVAYGRQARWRERFAVRPDLFLLKIDRGSTKANLDLKDF